MIKLVRDAEYIRNALVEKDGQIFTKVGCKIQFPARFINKELAILGSKVYCFGCFAIVADTGQYGVMNVNAMVELSPFKVIKIKLDEVEYYELHFLADTVVIKDVNLNKNDLLIYNVFDELIFNGKIPWYIDYEDLGKIFDTASSHANSSVAKNPEVIEFIAAMVSRSAEDRTKFFRTIIETYDDVKASNLEFVPLKSVFYSVNNTLNKLAGSYFTQGISSAIVMPSEQASEIEKIVRA